MVKDLEKLVKEALEEEKREQERIKTMLRYYEPIGERRT